MICSDCGSPGSFISHVIIITYNGEEEKETCFQCDRCGGSDFKEEEAPHYQDLQLEIVPVEREWNDSRPGDPDRMR